LKTPAAQKKIWQTIARLLVKLPGARSPKKKSGVTSAHEKRPKRRSPEKKDRARRDSLEAPSRQWRHRLVDRKKKSY